MIWTWSGCAGCFSLAVGSGGIGSHGIGLIRTWSGCVGYFSLALGCGGIVSHRGVCVNLFTYVFTFAIKHDIMLFKQNSVPPFGAECG